MWRIQGEVKFENQLKCIVGVYLYVFRYEEVNLTLTLLAEDLGEVKFQNERKFNVDVINRLSDMRNPILKSN
jgi:hypothetical protein